MNGVWLLLQLVFGFAVVLAPGALLARTLGVRGVSATLAWALALVFAALAVTFVVHGSLTLTLVLLLLAGAAALAAGVVRGRRRDVVSDHHELPHRAAVLAAGALLGLLLWHVAGHVGGDGFLREADGVVEENLVSSGLDDQGRQAGQVGEDGADEAESGVLSRRIVGDSGLEGFAAEQRVDLAPGLHGRPGQGEIGIR